MRAHVAADDHRLFLSHSLLGGKIVARALEVLGAGVAHFPCRLLGERGRIDGANIVSFEDLVDHADAVLSVRQVYLSATKLANFDVGCSTLDVQIRTSNIQHRTSKF